MHVFIGYLNVCELPDQVFFSYPAQSPINLSRAKCMKSVLGNLGMS